MSPSAFHRDRLSGVIVCVAQLVSGCLAPPGRSTQSALPTPSVTATPVEPKVQTCSPDRPGEPRLVVRRAYSPSEQFLLLSSELSIDGVRIFESSDRAELSKTIETIFDATIQPGTHEITGLQKLRGVGPNPISPLNLYTFQVTSKQAVKVSDRGATCATVALVVSNDETEPMYKRVSVRHDVVPPEAAVPTPPLTPQATAAEPRQPIPHP